MDVVNQGKREHWGTRAGVILAVTGSAVGLGNFLRFPGLAAEWGGAFMIPYVIAFLLLGLPVVWVEWSAGRWGGRRGFNSIIGIFYAITPRNRFVPYLGTFGMLIPVMIYMFYVYVASWCLGYAWMYATGAMAGVEDYAGFAEGYIGADKENGWAFANPGASPLIFLLITFVLNFILIYRGITRGIELFCKYAMPVLALLAMAMLVRVLTLSPPEGSPERTVISGLGYMWNPDFAVLSNPMIWLDAAGQVFFSLSIGFAIIITYASYVAEDDDVALSGMTAAAGNGFTEVVLAGLTIIPVGFMFLGDAVSERAGSSFQLGFMALPNVFDQMPAGQFFGFLFFFLLFLAAVTSTLSMLQPPIAFLEEGLNVGRKTAVTILGFITAFGCGFVVYFMNGTVALDTIDFWAVNMMIPILALVILIMYGWVLGVDKGFEELRHGAEIPVPTFVQYMIKYISPLFLLVIFVGLVYVNLFAEREEGADPTPFEVLRDNSVAQMSFGLIVVVLILFGLLTAQAVKRWRKEQGVTREAGTETEVQR